VHVKDREIVCSCSCVSCCGV